MLSESLLAKRAKKIAQVNAYHSLLSAKHTQQDRAAVLVELLPLFLQIHAEYVDTSAISTTTHERNHSISAKNRVFEEFMDLYVCSTCFIRTCL